MFGRGLLSHFPSIIVKRFAHIERKRDSFAYSLLTMHERSCIIFTMNRMPLSERAKILGFLVEGMSLRAASRLADCSINTVTKLLVDVGTACAEFQDKALRNLPCKRIQCDEIWSFVGAKQKNVAQGAAGHGDVWTWTAICADTKLVASWMVGSRDGAAAIAPKTKKAAQWRPSWCPGEDFTPSF